MHINGIVAVCKNKIRKDPTVASPADFVNIFLNRDFYILIQDYLKERMTSTDIPTFSQIKELIRVWILQFGSAKNEEDGLCGRPQVCELI